MDNDMIRHRLEEIVADIPPRETADPIETLGAANAQRIRDLAQVCLLLTERVTKLEEDVDHTEKRGGRPMHRYTAVLEVTVTDKSELMYEYDDLITGKEDDEYHAAVKGAFEELEIEGCEVKLITLSKQETL